MTVSALRVPGHGVNTNEQGRSTVQRLDLSQLLVPVDGTRVFSRMAEITAVTQRPASTPLAFYSDGSSLEASLPLAPRAWKAIPTSAGKTFEWEGLVVDVNDSTFTSRLRNIKGAKAEYDEFTEFDLADVPFGDRDLLLPGAIFRWVVGLESRSGTRQRYSRIVLRRLPAWTKKSFTMSEQKLRDIVSGINWVNNEPTSAG